MMRGFLGLVGVGVMGTLLGAPAVAADVASAPPSVDAVPSHDVVRSLCAPPMRGIGFHPWKWSYADGYLLCRASGVKHIDTIYHRDPGGEFQMLRQSEGAGLTMDELTGDLHIPPQIAQALDGALK